MNGEYGMFMPYFYKPFGVYEFDQDTLSEITLYNSYSVANWLEFSEKPCYKSKHQNEEFDLSKCLSDLNAKVLDDIKQNPTNSYLQAGKADKNFITELQNDYISLYRVDGANRDVTKNWVYEDTPSSDKWSPRVQEFFAYTSDMVFIVPEMLMKRRVEKQGGDKVEFILSAHIQKYLNHLRYWGPWNSDSRKAMHADDLALQFGSFYCPNGDAKDTYHVIAGKFCKEMEEMNWQDVTDMKASWHYMNFMLDASDKFGVANSDDAVLLTQSSIKVEKNLYKKRIDYEENIDRMRIDYQAEFDSQNFTTAGSKTVELVLAVVISLLLG